MAVGLSMDWHRRYCDRLVNILVGIVVVAMHWGLKWSMRIATIFQRPLTVPLHSPDGRQMPAVSAVQGDCERVYYEMEVTICRMRDHTLHIIPFLHSGHQTHHHPWNFHCYVHGLSKSLDTFHSDILNCFEYLYFVFRGNTTVSTESSVKVAGNVGIDILKQGHLFTITKWYSGSVKGDLLPVEIGSLYRYSYHHL